MNSDIFQSKWRGFLHHVVNVHEWLFGDNVDRAGCSHKQLDQPGRGKQWFETCSSSHKGLTKVIMNTRCCVVFAIMYTSGKHYCVLL